MAIRTVSSIHNRILKEKEKALVRDIMAKAPEIEKGKMITEFVNSVNQMSWRERFQIIWRVLWRKL